ncbi:unnamed protein product [Microthlaspi erraticum]|uniref:Uncharacterized protein n=1 Tax=Microthlaspi erraticum TaxID=1685480 RepID=A0A6D2I0J0_9BRAS|nr:unnamed protein product [Microthlaspi erraticum]
MNAIELKQYDDGCEYQGKIKLLRMGYLEMNHNTNIHFGNRTLIPHDLHGRSYQDPAVSIVPHPFPPNRAHPRLKDLAETSIITIIIKTDLRFIINHLDQCCIHTTTMFSIGGEIAISMPCLRVSWRAKEN